MALDFRSAVVVRTVIASLSSLWSASLLSAGLGFLGQLLLARSLSVDAFGVLNSALATVFLCAGLAGLGVAPFWLRVFALEGEKATRWIAPSVGLLLPVCVLTMLSIAAVAFVVWGSQAKAITIALLLPIIPFQVTLELHQSLMQVQGKYMYLAISAMTINGGRFLAGLLAFSLRINVIPLTIALCCYYVSAAGYSAKFVHRAISDGVKLARPLGQTVDTTDRMPTVSSVLLRAFPFALTGVAYLILLHAGVVITGFLGTERESGLYSAAFVIVTAAYLIPGIAFAKFLHPQMHVWAEHSPRTFYNAFRISALLAMTGGVVASVITFSFSSYIIVFSFGQEFAGSHELLRVLSLCILFRFVSASVSSVLITRNYHRYRIASEGTAALCCIILSVVLYNIVGVRGVALGTVAGEVVLCVLYGFFTLRYVFPKEHR